ncbi:hypothetical protein Mal15_42170 [Stieleria maiorica]|uniref:Uncharacterized protein n=1 Tax=Stieleria maiorica TaxID=2795974 RepID=A0A5B9MMP9_9BACT|nr:hypothetical protein Mal15_42170 [Stieleria maiorica]
MNYSVCKSYVRGRFDGFVDGWEYCLADGSVWRIIEPIYLIRKKTTPSASVYRIDDQYYLRVRGMPHAVEVEPVCLPRCTLEKPIGPREYDGPRQRSAMRSVIEAIVETRCLCDDLPSEYVQ